MTYSNMIQLETKTNKKQVYNILYRYFPKYILSHKFTYLECCKNSIFEKRHIYKFFLGYDIYFLKFKTRKKMIAISAKKKMYSIFSTRKISEFLRCVCTYDYKNYFF